MTIRLPWWLPPAAGIGVAIAVVYFVPGPIGIVSSWAIGLVMGCWAHELRRIELQRRDLIAQAARAMDRMLADLETKDRAEEARWN